MCQRRRAAAVFTVPGPPEATMGAAFVTAMRGQARITRADPVFCQLIGAEPGQVVGRDLCHVATLRDDHRLCRHVTAHDAPCTAMSHAVLSLDGPSCLRWTLTRLNRSDDEGTLWLLTLRSMIDPRIAAEQRAARHSDR